MRVAWAKLVSCLVLCFAAAGIGGFYTAPAIAGWYATLAKPWFTPPNWVFAPAWTILYALMAFSLYLFWTSKLPAKEVKKKSLGYALFFAQLLLNVLWSVVFFGLRQPQTAFTVIVLLELSIIATAFLFNKASRTAALLLIPYALWVAFAAFLNYAVWTLN